MPWITTTDGVSLHYKDWGRGKPVILIHGWPLNADMWEHQAPLLAEEGLRVIAYDRRGFGRSEQPWEGYDYDTLAADLKALIDQLDLEEVALVGFSMGGGEVTRYLARYGNARVARAVLVGAVTPFLLRAPDNPEGIEGVVFDRMVAELQADRPAFLADFMHRFFGAGLLNFAVSEPLLAWARGLALQASPKATADCVRAFSETDFRADLAHFTVPTLIIHGTHDAIVPIEISGQKTAAAVPGAVLLEYEGAPHGLFHTARDRLTADLLAFIADGEPGDPNFDHDPALLATPPVTPR